MLFVPIGYTFGAGMFKMDSIRGGTPYGAGVFAGDGSRQPTETELALAEHQGKYMASVVKRLSEGWWSHTSVLVYTLIPVYQIICVQFVIGLWTSAYCSQFFLLFVLSAIPILLSVSFTLKKTVHGLKFFHSIHQIIMPNCQCMVTFTIFFFCVCEM